MVKKYLEGYLAIRSTLPININDYLIDKKELDYGRTFSHARNNDDLSKVFTKGESFLKNISGESDCIKSLTLNNRENK